MDDSKVNFKIIYILLDGVGDLPNASLKGSTPLEYASTPNLDEITKNGCMGSVISVGKGIAPQSDIAVFNMLGYNFKNGNYVGRGVIESIGCNIDFNDGDLALRGNFASVDENNKIIDRRAGRVISKEESSSICDSIKSNLRFSNGEVSIEIVPTVGHRVTARIRCKGTFLSEKVSNTDPAYDKIDGIGIAKPDSNNLYIARSEPQNEEDSSKLSASLVNEFSDKVIEVLRDHPVNIIRKREGKKPINSILFRDAGNKTPILEPIYSRHKIRFASLVDMPVEIGISKVLAMSSYEAGGLTDYQVKAKKAIEILSDHDAVYVHIKGPDEFGHDGDAQGKMKNIEDIDKSFFGVISEYSHKYDNIYTVVSADHSTPCIKKAHTDDAIPLLVAGKGIVNDGSKRFTEKFGINGKIGQIMGFVVLDTAIDMIRRNVPIFYSTL